MLPDPEEMIKISLQSHKKRSDCLPPQRKAHAPNPMFSISQNAYALEERTKSISQNSLALLSNSL